jgi:hypothetical protein
MEETNLTEAANLPIILYAQLCLLVWYFTMCIYIIKESTII